MKISQEDVILIKNLYLSKQCGTRRVLSELPDKGSKLGTIDSLLKRSHKTGTSVPLPGSVTPRSSRGCGGPGAQSGGQKGIGQLVRFYMKLPCHSLFKCRPTQKNNHRDLQLT